MAANYAHPLKWYSENYKLALGTIQNCGRRKWPLDDATKLLEKFLNLKGGFKPDLSGLIAYASGGKKLPARRAPKSEPTSEQPPVDRTELGVGLQDEFTRIKAESARSHREYLAERDPAQRLVLQKIWLANSAALRQLAKPARQSEVDLKNWLEKSDVEATWTRAISEFRSNVENLGRRISTLSIFKGVDPVDIEEAVSRETAKMIADLRKAGEFVGKDQP